MVKINYFRLVVSIVICQMAGLIGSVFTGPAVQTWYPQLNQPSFNPPSWVFAPVWTTLFLLMGISLYLVWNKGLKSEFSRTAVFIFGIQLILNILWSILFFGLQSPLSGFIEIILLWLMIAMSIVYFYKISKPAAYLLVPYILWVSFAAVLNLSYVLLN